MATPLTPAQQLELVDTILHLRADDASLKQNSLLTKLKEDTRWTKLTISQVKRATSKANEQQERTAPACLLRSFTGDTDQFTEVLTKFGEIHA